MEKSVVLVSAKRTPFGRYLGAFSAMDPVALAAAACRAALAQADLPAGVEVGGLFVGNCMPSAFDTASVVGRQLGLELGLGCFAQTIDTACCSPLTALRMACQGIRLGEFDVALVAGVESMSRVPHVARGLRTGVRAGPLTLEDPIFPIQYKGYAPVAVDGEKGAMKYGVTREMMDRWALGSQQKWAAAYKGERLVDELAPVEVASRRMTALVERDEQPRPDTMLERLAILKGVFGTQSITPGNAPGLNDGAAAAVVMSSEKAAELGLEPLAEVVATVGETAAPDGIAWVPALAIRKALAQAKLTVKDLELIEINEAFAAMPLVSTKVLADEDEERWHQLMEITNVNGGAVAIGHPVGASGLRILSALVYELRRRNTEIGVAAICGGLSQGEAVIVKC